MSARAFIAAALVLACAPSNENGRPGARTEGESASGAARDMFRGTTNPVRDECLATGPDLSSLGEPPLIGIDGAASAEAVRFFWFPTFHGSVSIRLTRRGDEYALVSSRIPDRVPDDSVPVARRDSSRIDAAQWGRLTRPLSADGFWSPDPSRGAVHIDGSVWLVEYLRAGECRAVKYWSPEAVGAGAAIHAFGMSMFTAAGIIPEMIY